MLFKKFFIIFVKLWLLKIYKILQNLATLLYVLRSEVHQSTSVMSKKLVEYVEEY